MAAPSSTTMLVRAGFENLAAARSGLAELGPVGEAVLEALAKVADPDLALRTLLDLLAALDDSTALVDTLVADTATTTRLVHVLGASQALGEHLVRHPHHWRELQDPTLACTRSSAWFLRDELLRSVGADPTAQWPVATLSHPEAVDALRVEYRRLLLRVAARDLAHGQQMDDTAAELSDLATGTLEAALAVARAWVGAEADDVRLSVIAMGKCGAHELNYVSDVDVIFVHEPVDGIEEHHATRVATQVASQMMRVCSDHTREGTIWPVDAGLRPEGNQGPLVRTLASHHSYYERWAKSWEFQALLKARPVAGDVELGQRFCDMVAPLVWTVAERDGFVQAARAMRRRVLEHIPSKEAKRQLKLGVGGLRDVEFAVQLLQLVHGRADPTVRAPTTLSGLFELTRGGYVGRADGEALHEAYTFLRTLEHRLQLFQLRRIHVVPEDEESLRRLGRAMGFFRDSGPTLEEEWQRRRRLVRRLHEKLFYRPLLEAVARIPGPDARLTLAQAEDRLKALGYGDPRAALRHLEALTAGVSRSANIQRTLLPVMLEWFAETPNPDAGLFGFRRLSESLGDSHWYLRQLRDEGQVAHRLATVLSTSRFVSALLEREPQGVKILGDDLTPLTKEALTAEAVATALRHPQAVDAVRAVRGIRRRELLRIAVGEIFGETDVEEAGRALTALTDATLEATLQAVLRDQTARRGLDEPPARMAIVAMGRYGGDELSYASDADVIFVHEVVPGADPNEASQFAAAVANDIRTLLAAPGTDPALEIDADLRPEGRQGALTRSLDSYAAYYAKWSATWEAQALLRADAVIGDPDLRKRFTALVDPLRYPPRGADEDDVLEVRRIKARVDNERLPRGADPHTHFKLGRGGLADIEWTVQLIQMQWAGRVPALRQPATLPSLEAGVEASLVEAEDAKSLRTAWRLVSRMRNAATLVRGNATDHIPQDAKERASLAFLMGYDMDDTDRMVNDYLRTTRRAHAVVDRIFWG
ncbi:bifunctional [glutamine synthetase] adenylyltransferase/[glutamine synthetase]-adenylyl-L-tyrosine phosphorylase [Nocardioides jishulii]|uniref:Bifunctional glutamine synthetase adenylyltransferase/adenylyl-removing enzyme n=1 Tax=Nocardioides jishulii TaxID=2575440 RepID=A0A4U2YN40_9ACTN|nr:bifunctional [glutamine synthetase] adenylyltransferase/[glutamine synthetase]-adenylyl-L-tyrosine phosphorylase [Nocardioides jishulii]QCX27872.1 bifunctional [glutamine synthetase] adenylyltransferase/[glutamine synthetase]-adenylyl-L-tyrosine phosphorylase [Nocardioides jishulii]TKI62679.1 bifunctional [glutamine synthetase] adenylyltransferase/[glutamine synthetase]-adenylyl-L-tyrosine phosphorylase [Nocardioides jishulii]